MAHKHDYWERIRQTVIPAIGKVVQLINELTRYHLYVESQSRENQLVGRIQMDVEEFEEWLHYNGFERNPLSSLKTRLSSEEVEEGSWRKVWHDDEDFQLHVIYYDGSEIPYARTGETFIYAHKEYRWDTHPFKHYRGDGLDEKTGVLKVRQLLDESDITYDYVQP